MMSYFATYLWLSRAISSIMVCVLFCVIKLCMNSSHLSWPLLKKFIFSRPNCLVLVPGGWIGRNPLRQRFCVVKLEPAWPARAQCTSHYQVKSHPPNFRSTPPIFGSTYIAFSDLHQSIFTSNLKHRHHLCFPFSCVRSRLVTRLHVRTGEKKDEESPKRSISISWNRNNMRKDREVVWKVRKSKFFF